MAFGQRQNPAFCAPAASTMQSPACACRPGEQAATARPTSSSSSSSPWLAPRQQQQHTRQRQARLAVRAVRKEQQAGGLGRLEAAVPREQRPVNELQQIKSNLLCSWVSPGWKIGHVERSCACACCRNF